MRDEKEGRKKQARSHKQQGKATQYTPYIYTTKQVCILVPFVVRLEKSEGATFGKPISMEEGQWVGE